MCPKCTLITKQMGDYLFRPMWSLGLASGNVPQDTMIQTSLRCADAPRIWLGPVLTAGVPKFVVGGR